LDKLFCQEKVSDHLMHEANEMRQWSSCDGRQKQSLNGEVRQHYGIRFVQLLLGEDGGIELDGGDAIIDAEEAEEWWMK
jgi:hypothetical protein